MGATPAARSTAAWPSAKAKLGPSCVSCWHSGSLRSWAKTSSGRSRMGRASVRRPMPGAQRNVNVRRQGRQVLRRTGQATTRQGTASRPRNAPAVPARAGACWPAALDPMTSRGHGTVADGGTRRGQRRRALPAKRRGRGEGHRLRASPAPRAAGPAPQKSPTTQASPRLLGRACPPRARALQGGRSPCGGPSPDRARDGPVEPPNRPGHLGPSGRVKG